MMCRFITSVLAILLTASALMAQSPKSWPADFPWWKINNLRTIQFNLPATEAATLNADSVVADLKRCFANTLIINIGGIMAFYPTQLDFHYRNPYLRSETVMKDIIDQCHLAGIKVMVRFDFSRIHESIFKAHPDWCYLSPKGERVYNTDMVVVSINAPYVQQKAFDIIAEVLDTFPIDGIFLNMPGYQVNNPYEGVYHGIDQNEHDQKRFAEYSKGLALPTKEDKTDPVFQKYLAFKQYTVEDWTKRLHELIKSKNENVALCTYMDEYVDIIRHESQTNSLPYWPYSASDNVNNAIHTFPHHTISNASIQQISFQSRYNAVEPNEVRIRLYENIANGSGLDLSMMGDMQDYEDERNYKVIREVYGFHKAHEKYFGRYKTTAKIALIAPGSWPSGLPMQEYRGIQLMLKEAHLSYDIIEDAQLQKRAEDLKKYALILLPDITFLPAASVEVLKELSRNGTHLVATNRSLSDHPEALRELFGAKTTQMETEGSGYYLTPVHQPMFRRLAGQKMIMWKFNLGKYDWTEQTQKQLPILAKGRPGPPEIIGGHDSTGYYALGLHPYGKAVNALLPVNLGRLYYLHGYQEHKNILLDLIDHLDPHLSKAIQTNAPDRVEVILQEFTENTPAALTKKTTDGLILHLVNLTGFSGNTYFEPLPVRNLTFRLKASFKPSKIQQLGKSKAIPFTYTNDTVQFVLPELEAFTGIILTK
ncbi:alpha-amylase family protein [Siphonobacter sp. SORGH_AS_1065]|uniref:alpha-amylase family protein n=1 Tax=Siphonobacter sp. SORGH_AS_1065 TaxID=3041795 RepID=UPI00277EF948|nr:alpha-amylase family protein [Siphonobacter sp. SORGH_AS_1065]MDQ1090306.1 hypothetical protein [Siphonobacter sp. SORGH_AS_1065]